MRALFSIRTLVALMLIIFSANTIWCQETEFYFSDPAMAKKFQETLEKERQSGTEGIGNVKITTRSADGNVRSTSLIENRRLIQQAGKYGFEDSVGTLIIPCKYDFANDFNSGCAVVGKKNPAGSKTSYYKWHIDRNGKPIYPNNLYCDVHDFVNGYAVVDVTGGYQMCHIKRDGKPLYTQRYTYCWDFNKNGKAVVERAIPGKDLVRYMVINTSGSVVGFKEFSFSEDRGDQEYHKRAIQQMDQWLGK